MKQNLLTEVERAMECAKILGVAGFSTRELESLALELLSTDQPSEKLAADILLANRWHYYDPDGGGIDESFFELENSRYYSYSFFLEPLFNPSPAALSGLEVNTSDLQQMLLSYWRDHQTYTNRWVGWIENTPDTLNPSDLEADSKLMSEDSGHGPRREIDEERFTNSVSQNSVSFELDDISQSLRPSEIVWNLRRFIDLFFLQDGNQPFVSVHHYRAFDIFQDSDDNFESFEALEKISVEISLPSSEQGTPTSGALYLISIAKFFDDTEEEGVI